MSRIGIDFLPAELLVLIFQHGSQATLHELSLPFTMIVSHVSRQWRELVYASASVWRAIPSTSPTLLNVYLRMSQTYTIDVYLHARPRVGDVGILGIVDFLLEHSHRWRSLYIRANTAPLLFLVISRLRRARAPRLQRFELYVDAQPHTVGQLPTIFVDNPPPMLTSVTLEGIGFTGMINVPMLSGLTSLTLARLPRGMGQMAHTAFKDLLGSSPGLKHLALDGVIPRLLPDVEYEEIVLPNLHSLDLTIPNGSQHVQQLFTFLSAPALRILRYRSGWNFAWNLFELSLPVLSAKYHDIQELYFTNTVQDVPFVDDGVDPVFFTAFPKLRLFSLEVSKDALATYFLLPWIEVHSNPEAEDLPELILPNLELLTIRAPYDADSLISLDESLDMLRSLRLSLGLPFDVLKGEVVADETVLMTMIPDNPPSYER